MRTKLQAVGAALVVALSGCGSDGDAALQASRLARYCDLFRQVDEAFAPGAGPDGAPAPEALAAFGPTLDELQQVAPGDIAAEAETYAAALRPAQEGEASGVGDPAFTEARGALLAFNAERCPVPGESSGEA